MDEWMDEWRRDPPVPRAALSLTLSTNSPSPDLTIAITGWYSPDAVIISGKRWTPAPLIHIMKAKKATLLADPVARDVMAACFRAKEGVLERGVVARAEAEVEGGAAWMDGEREARSRKNDGEKRGDAARPPTVFSFTHHFIARRVGHAPAHGQLQARVPAFSREAEAGEGRRGGHDGTREKETHADLLSACACVPCVAQAWGWQEGRGLGVCVCEGGRGRAVEGEREE